MDVDVEYIYNQINDNYIDLGIHDEEEIRYIEKCLKSQEKLYNIKNYLKQLKHYQFEYDLGLGLNKINGCEEDFVKDILEIIGDI